MSIFDSASKGIGTGIGIAAMGIGLGIAFNQMRQFKQYHHYKKKTGSMPRMFKPPRFKW